MAWEVDYQVPRVADSDLASYKFYLNGSLAGTVSVGGLNPIPFTYAIPNDGNYNLQASAVDMVGNESMKNDASVAVLDSVVPSVPPAGTIVAIRFI